MDFNERQKEAVQHKNGPMMVLAGPGSGKTAVIAGRLQNLLNAGTAGNRILVVTFTRAAAAEMRQRFLKESGREYSEITFGTFHSIYYNILRASDRQARPEVLSERDKLKLLKEILSHIFPDSDAEAELPAQTAREISLLKGSGTSLENFYSSVLPSETFRKACRIYEDWKKENRLLDFDDIIVRCYELFCSRPEVLQKWQQRFQYFLIDEFQDISPLQYKIIRMLARPCNNLFIVGDDDQSIYRFRGANPDIMLHFPKDYPDCRTVNLNVNYRSHPEILDAAGRLICHNKKRYKKELKAEKEEGGQVLFAEFKDPREECSNLAQKLRKAHEKGEAYEDMAVLFRTNSGCREAIEQLMAWHVPFTAADILPCVYDHWICKDLLAYMRIAAGEKNRALFLQIYNKPNRYFSRDAFRDPVITFDLLYDYYEDKDWMCDRVETMQNDLAMLKKLPPYGAVIYIRKQIGYEQYLSEYAGKHHIQKEELFQILDELAESARNYKSLQEWTDAMDRYRDRLQEEKKQKSDTDARKGVMISTLHASKGMEYNSVYILDVNEGIIPYKKAVLSADMEEERRMLYVGMTRAKEDLHIYSVRERYDKRIEPSRFICEIAGQ
ncbi:MAG: ATP-dependent helicase [Eubacterium sp.]|nr:ATP-dependent helicase [Eubacterium sp.]